MADARTEILARIRSQLGRSNASETATTAATVANKYAAVPRAYVQGGTQDQDACIRLLLDRLVDYDAELYETDEAGMAETTATVLRRHAEHTLLVPSAVPAKWLPVGFVILREEEGRELSLAELTQANAVLTDCAGAIAETGTLLLAHDRGSGRRALSLLPDHHICVLRRSQVVETVSKGFALLAARSTSAITTVSGPSATADIEMTRIRGVHGPRRLTVLLLP